jgi:hypothetical protein
MDIKCSIPVIGSDFSIRLHAQTRIFFPGVNRTEREADISLPSVAEVKNVN